MHAKGNKGIIWDYYLKNKYKFLEITNDKKYHWILFHEFNTIKYKWKLGMKFILLIATSPSYKIIHENKNTECYIIISLYNLSSKILKSKISKPQHPRFWKITLVIIVTDIIRVLIRCTKRTIIQLRNTDLLILPVLILRGQRWLHAKKSDHTYLSNFLYLGYITQIISISKMDEYSTQKNINISFHIKKKCRIYF